MQEEQAMMLIVNAGNAKSKAMESIKASKAGNFEKAKKLLEEGDEAMTEAHKIQTDILQDSMDAPEQGVNMLMAHAEDHMMGAISAVDFANEFYDLYQLIYKKILKED